MKNTAINTLKYTGIVTLSQYISGKKFNIAKLHNKGGNALFSFLASCLVGDFTLAYAARPTKVMLLERINPDEEDSEAEYDQPEGSIGFMTLITKPEIISNVGIGKVRYSFVIPKNIVDKLNFDNLYLGLYADGAVETQPNNYAAICKLAIAKTIVANTSLLVDWELSISNISTVE